MSGYEYTGYEAAFIPGGQPVPQDDANIGNVGPLERMGTFSGNPYGDQRKNTTPNNISLLKPTIKSNPLSAFSSYTYNLTLYMATPEALNKFVSTGNFDSKDDFFIVAQSGGTNPKEKRAMTIGNSTPGANSSAYNYYIDDLHLGILLTGSSGTPTLATSVKFKIIEPIGFNFFTQLSKISGHINSISEILKQSDTKPPPLRQNYILSIRFYGYDDAGNLMTAKQAQNPTMFLNSNINEKESLVSKYASYERFFTFMMTSASYQLDGRNVTYDIEGAPISHQVGQGTLYSYTRENNEIIAATVDEAINGLGKNSSIYSKGLMQLMKERSESEVATKRAQAGKTTTYSVKFTKKAAEELQKSKLVETDIFYRINAPGSPADSTRMSNIKTALAQRGIPPEKRVYPFGEGTSLIQIMDQLLIRSEYVANKLIAENDERIETSSKPSDTTTQLEWYSIKPVVTVGGMDNITKNWFYHIEYEISLQKIRYIRSLYYKNLTAYNGPHKIYNFFLTGKNTEVINFQQKYETQFYLLQAASATGNANVNPQNTTPNHASGGTPGTPLLSGPNRSTDIQNSTAVAMNSIADQVTAELTILGDPDYIVSNVLGIPDIDKTSFSTMYGSGADAMNPYIDQILIEIVIKGADDYKQDGTLNIIPVDFYSLIDESTVKEGLKKPEGIVYRVWSVDCTFLNGKFTQVLSLILVNPTLMNLQKINQEESRPVRPSEVNGEEPFIEEESPRLPGFGYYTPSIGPNTGFGPSRLEKLPSYIKPAVPPKNDKTSTSSNDDASPPRQKEDSQQSSRDQRSTSRQQEVEPPI